VGAFREYKLTHASARISVAGGTIEGSFLNWPRSASAPESIRGASRPTMAARSARRSLAAPYAFGERKWDFEQINALSGSSLHNVLRRAAPHYGDAEFQAVSKRLPARVGR
jgi:hypothetical protein